ncbi:GH32 C-terminal domain-containing protein [Ensifer aridi]|uniref:GH32 C-terminal domain-containing protein n=1 Tax=Ensifer aridi TaxID=1708715 RepID=UPI00047C32BC|nr:GH32 C-terminal domain-containing protein [Ensifer aridi]
MTSSAAKRPTYHSASQAKLISDPTGLLQLDMPLGQGPITELIQSITDDAALPHSLDESTNDGNTSGAGDDTDDEPDDQEQAFADNSDDGLPIRQEAESRHDRKVVRQENPGDRGHWDMGDAHSLVRAAEVYKDHLAKGFLSLQGLDNAFDGLRIEADLPELAGSLGDLVSEVAEPTHGGFASAAVAASLPPPPVEETTTASEPYRPTYHFTPETNWINDPNGLFYLDGVYHMFFQYNPEGSQWGNMSWGHATSTDLVNWTEHEVALPYSAEQQIFSGSIVVDYNNTSGFGYGPNGEPPVVAIYTANIPPQNGEPQDQEQALAFSHDGGMTWTFYDGNPVLDIPDPEFRDPKVFWQDNPGDDDYWVMGVARPLAREAEFYKSYDLKDWSYLSSFGPANAVGGIWEVPDLIKMTVENTGETKYLLIQNLNPGGIAGGSAAQYFIGDWDGVTFTADNINTAGSPGDVVFDGFESGYGGWSVEGSAFGPGPASGAIGFQSPVVGFDGAGLVNSFRDAQGNAGDAGTGRMLSDTFTIEKNFINFKIGGGGHAINLDVIRDPGAPGGTTIADFEYGLPAGWVGTGHFATTSPVVAGNSNGPGQLANWDGVGLLSTFNVPDGTYDGPTGTITSPEFVIDAKYINFKIGGGNHNGVDTPDPLTQMQLIVDGQVVRTMSGGWSEALGQQHWDVEEFIGKSAQIRIVDENSGGFGYIMVDSIEMNDSLPATGEIFEDWEVDGPPPGWTASGDFAGSGGLGPIGTSSGSGFGSDVGRVLDTFYSGDPATGELTSDAFTITKDFINVRMGGGGHTGEFGTTVDLLINGQVVDFATGKFSGILDWTSWDVSEYVGQQAQIRIRDASSSNSWGHIFVDRIEFADEAFTPTQLSPTAINLIVDGQRVATASGNFDEVLDWKGWDVSQYVGKEAQIEIIDYNTGAWGHINVDAITFADSAYPTSKFLADWIDYGADNYATISWHNLPEGERPTTISWMNNWTYAASIPTGDFRGSMTIPREYSLREIDGEVRLIQTPVEQLKELRREHVSVNDVTVADGELKAPLEGNALEIVATFDAAEADASRFGVKVRVGDGEETLVGYDATTGEVFIDRTESGIIPAESFAAIHTAPLEVTPDGDIKLHIFVDAASVELFANDGLRTITDQIFPNPGSLGVELFAEGGTAAVDLDIWKLSTEDEREQAPRSYVGTVGNDLLTAWEGATGALRFDSRGGDDVIVGSVGLDRINGGTGADVLRGGRGSDWLDGGRGNDMIAAGGGALDHVLGGAGADLFLFATETRDGHRDRTVIGDFKTGIDAIDLGEAEVVSHKSLFGSLVLTLDGDGDQIVLTGVARYDDSLFV